MTSLVHGKAMSSGPPALVISLDFELHWGMSDIVTSPDHAYMANLWGAREVIPAMLDLFCKKRIRATWATVGFLFAGAREELERFRPRRLPDYQRTDVNNWLLEIGEDEASDPLHYARSLIERIAATPGQEVASHTFSHYYCHEPGQTPEDFLADLQAARAIANHAGHCLDSLVLPRNQLDDAYLDCIRQAGFRCYRGNPLRAGFGRNHRNAAWMRALRLLDSHIDLTGPHTVRWSDLARNVPVDIPASMFLRPYSGIAALDVLRLRRIKNAMQHAAERNEIFHLWWHPHNFGTNVDENLRGLNALIEHFQRLSSEFGMQSLSMADVLARAMSAEATPEA